MSDAFGFTKMFRVIILFSLVFLPSGDLFSAESNCQKWLRSHLAPFKLGMKREGLINKALAPIVEGVTANLPGIRWANQRALKLSNRRPDQNVFSKALEVTDIQYDLYAPFVHEIPKTGPVIFVSNHRGMDDAMIDGDWALRLRPDLKFVIGLNAALLPDLHPYSFVVDNSEKESQAAKHIRFLKDVIQHLRGGAGRALFWYPSDYVDRWNRWKGEVAPHPFFNGINFVVKNSGATIVPVYHDSLNHSAFYRLSYLFRNTIPVLSSALLPWALSKKEGMTLKTYVGKPITPQEWQEYASTKSRRDLPDFLQSKVEQLPELIRNLKPTKIELESLSSFYETIANDYAPELGRREIENLGSDSFLVGSLEGEQRFLVLRFFAEEAPMLTRGIGIGREIAFRGVGEGTGLALDLDELDLSKTEPRFEQMAVVNREDFNVVAGYRFKRGVTYTAQFYERLPKELLGGSTLELSRAWVIPKLQNGMMISSLWSGIGKILSLNPDIDQMLGIASMSAKDYSEEIRQLTAYFLLHGPYRLESDQEYKAIHSPSFSAFSESEMKEILKDVKDIDDFERLIRQWPSRKVDLSQVGIINDHDPDGYTEGKPLPPLISGYIKMGAKFFGASIDPSFQDSLDFALLIRLKDIPAPYLKRFVGIEAYERVRAHQGSNLEPSD